MEDNDLKERWRGLHQVVSSLGPPHQVDRDLAGQTQSLLFAGDTHVVVQAGKLSHRGALRAWLQHLHLSCEGSAVDTSPDRPRQPAPRPSSICGGRGWPPTRPGPF